MRHFIPMSVAALLALPVCARAQTQAPPAAPPSAAQPAADTEPSRSLFDETWQQFEVGGRWSTIDGDPARFQRYQDLGSGVLLTNVRYAVDREFWSFKGTAENVGWRDQRYRASYDRPGRFLVSGFWDEIPQFYSVDTKTPYVAPSNPSVLVLDDGIQRSIQNGQANLNAYVPVAPQFDLRERRDIGHVDFLAFTAKQIDISGKFTTTKHVGELPWGASFGFNNDVEVALPYDSRTNDLTVGAEWKNSRGMFRAAYDGSWFDNPSQTLQWDSPLRVDDSTSAPGRGQMSLWPSNSANTVSAAGYAKFAHRTQATGYLSFGAWSNNEALLPFTINSALTQLALPRPTADAQAHVINGNLGLVSHPSRDWRFSGRLRSYDYSNQTPAGHISQFVSYDTSVNTSLTGGPEPFSHNRTDLNLDATWTGLRPFAFTGGYARNHAGYDYRTFEDTGENVYYATVDAVGSQWLTFRTRYEYGDRNGSGLDEASLVHIGEQPGMRHFDLANRTRNRFTGTVEVIPSEVITLSASAGLGDEHYGDTGFGLQEATVHTYTVSADYARPDGWGGGASYDYERYFGAQQSRSTGGSDDPNDPRHNWTVDSRERVDYFLVYVNPPRFGNTETRVSYDYAYSRGNYLYNVVPGGLPPPSQLPEVYNRLQELKLDVRHRVSAKLAATVNYRYEPFHVYDFAFDPSVVNGIVQPSSLVLGYVYRPYTAHSLFAALRYHW